MKNKREIQLTQNETGKQNGCLATVLAASVVLL